MQQLDPFQVEPLPKAFYHPTKEKELTKKEKKVCLSVPSIPQQLHVSSPEDIKFLNDPKMLKIEEIREIPTRENGSYADHSSSSQFNESWPSTERTGSLGTPGSDTTLTSPEMTQQMREWLTGQDSKPTTNKTTLGWYINRFRNAPPTSRQSRDRSTVGTNQNLGNFWWLSPPSGQSTPTLQEQDTPPQKLKPSPQSTKTTTNKFVSKPPVSTSTPNSLQSSDKTIDDLNKRAKELLEKSESSLDTISTEPFPLPLKKPTITKPKTLDTMSKSVFTSIPHNADTTSTSSSPTTPHNPWPEDDILYQWRLARKMEKAQDRASLIRPTGQPALQRVQSSNHDRIGSLTLTHNSYDTTRARGPSRSRNDLINRKNPLDNDHEEMNNISLGYHKINEPGLEAALTLNPEEQTSSYSDAQQVTHSGQSSQGQIHSTKQHITGPPRPAITMTTIEHTAPICTDAVSGMRTTDVTITTSTMNRPIVTPVVVPPCQHGSTSTYSLGVQPHMHLACDIIPCPCPNSPEKSCTHCKQSHLHVNYKQNELINSEEEYPQKHSTARVNMHSQDNRTSKTSTHLCKSSKKTTEKAAKDTFHDVKNVKRTRHDTCTKDISRDIDIERAGSGRINNVKGSGRRGTYQSVPRPTPDENRREEAGTTKWKSKTPHTCTSDILDNVIGKVVSEHLFLGESSSSESNDTKGPPEKRSPKQTHKGTTPNDVREFPQENLLASSEEEFSDDEILKMLRQRSRELQSKLREIDQSLQNI